MLQGGREAASRIWHSSIVMGLSAPSSLLRMARRAGSPDTHRRFVTDNLHSRHYLWCTIKSSFCQEIYKIKNRFLAYSIKIMRFCPDNLTLFFGASCDRKRALNSCQQLCRVERFCEKEYSAVWVSDKCICPRLQRFAANVP